MTPAPTRPLRREDQLWFKAIERLGLPTVLCVGLFWAWDGSVKQERELAARREERLTTVIAGLKGSLDTLNGTLLAQSARVGELAVRVERLEDLGARAMERRHLTAAPTTKGTP